MYETNFNSINQKLLTCITTHCPAVHIHQKANVNIAINSLTNILKEVINKEVPVSKLSPFAKQWWTKELTNCKREKNRLSNLSYRYCIKMWHWLDWLKDTSYKDIYIANKYATNPPSNYSSTRIPHLRMTAVPTMPMSTLKKLMPPLPRSFPLLQPS